MNRTTAWSVVAALGLAGAVSCGCAAPLPPQLSLAADNRPDINVPWHCFGGVPVRATDAGTEPTTSSNPATVCHRGYVVVYDSSRRTPAVVCQRLTAAQFSGFWAKRLGIPFTSDERLAGPQAEPQDYKGDDARGYDPGHMAPSADFDADRKLLAESFKLSNIAPQRENFNRSVWREFEMSIRRWVKSNGDVFVLTGPLRGGGELSEISIGRNKVVVPDAFFKAVVWRNAGGPWRLNCFVVQHRHAGPQVSRVSDKTVPLVELERAAGFDLFPNVSATQLAEMETDNGALIEHLGRDKL